MIVRLLLFAALAWLVWRLVRRWQGQLRNATRSDSPKNFELMQRCTQCGAYLPANALSSSGRCGRCSD